MKKVARGHAEMQTYTPAEIQTVLRTADKDRNGHLYANPAITARIYAHSQDEALAAAASLGAVVANGGVLRDL